MSTLHLESIDLDAVRQAIDDTTANITSGDDWGEATKRIDALLDRYSADEEVEAVINFVTGLLDGEKFSLNEEVARSDETGGDLNRSLLSLTKHFGNLRNEIAAVMRAYVRQCAIELTCKQLARSGRFLLLDTSTEPSKQRLKAMRRARRRFHDSLRMVCGHAYSIAAERQCPVPKCPRRRRAGA